MNTNNLITKIKNINKNEICKKKRLIKSLSNLINDNEQIIDIILGQQGAAQDEYRQLITKYTGNNVSTAINYNNSATQSNDVDSTTPAQSGNDTDDGMDHTAQTGKVIGDTKTHIYHTEDQHDYKISPKNEVVFDNEQQAINAGYRKALR